MIEFSPVFDSVSVSVLFIAVNVAIAATLISAVSFFASRMRVFSSPVKHAICVCGVAGVVMAPLPVLSLAGLTWGLVEIIVKDRSAPDHTSHGFFADRKYATNDVMSSESSLVAPPNTESHVVDATTSRSPFDSTVAESRPSATLASPKDNGPAISSDEGFTFDGVTCGKILLLTWIIGSLILLMQRLVAEYRLRRWLAECVPISDLETLQAVQLAANAAGLSEQPILRQLAVQFRRRRWLARRGRIANVETLEAVQSAGLSVGLTKQPILLWSRALPAPVVCGVMQPALILPEAVAEGLSRDQFVAVLTHELAHVARRDLATGVWLTIARIAYWWNPLVRILCNRIENLSEQICDDIATASLQDPRDYASALLCFAERATNFTQQPASLGLSMSTISQLEFRVQRILKSTRSKTLRVSATVCVIVVLMTTVLAAAASMIQIRAASNEMPAEENIVVTQTGLNATRAVEPIAKIRPEDLDKPQTVVLRTTALVEAVCMVNPAKSRGDDIMTIHDGDGVQVAAVIPSMTAVGNGFDCRFRFRLPTGKFSLRRHVWTDRPTVTSFEFEAPPEGTFFNLGSIDRLSDSLSVDGNWGSVVGRVMVTNAATLQLRPKKILLAGARGNFWGDVFS